MIGLGPLFAYQPSLQQVQHIERGGMIAGKWQAWQEKSRLTHEAGQLLAQETKDSSGFQEMKQAAGMVGPVEFREITVQWMGTFPVQPNGGRGVEDTACQAGPLEGDHQFVEQEIVVVLRKESDFSREINGFRVSGSLGGADQGQFPAGESVDVRLQPRPDIDQAQATLTTERAGELALDIGHEHLGAAETAGLVAIEQGMHPERQLVQGQ